VPSEVPFHDLKTKLEAFGVVCRVSPHGHVNLRREVDGTILVYTIALVSGRRVLPVYIKKLRRALQLDPEHGVSDADFPFATGPQKPKKRRRR
jgi:hypothetical protein